MEYEYEALHEDELTLRPGEVIKNVRYIEEDGWMEGDLNGKRGLFPDNFVKVRTQKVVKFISISEYGCSTMPRASREILTCDGVSLL